MATTTKKTSRKQTKKTPVKKSVAKKNTPSTKKTPAKKLPPAVVKTASAAVAPTKTVKQNSSGVKKEKPAVKTKSVFQRLRVWNWALAALHAAQGVAVLILSRSTTLPVTTNFLTTDPIVGTTEQPVLVPATRQLFDVDLAYVIAAFFFLSALAHLSIATWYRKRYERELGEGINRARWIEYSLSASTMIVAIAMIAGIYDLSTLVMMFGLTAVMNLTGLVMELVNRGRAKIDWSAYIVGCIAGILPWIVYSFYVVGSSKYGESGPPTFVYFILVSIFLFFNVFAINMLLQYKKVGRWASYLYGERVYMILSLVAKSALAWQVFAGTLRP
jgi:hypothetical protein